MLHKLVLISLLQATISLTLSSCNWIPFKSKEYYFSLSKLSALKAFDYCQRLTPGGHLVVLSDPDVQEFLIQRIPRPPLLTRPYKYHIGLVQTDSFKWIDGTKYSSKTSLWYPGEPKQFNNAINFVSMGETYNYDSTFRWKVSAYRTEKANYICERPNSKYRNIITPAEVEAKKSSQLFRLDEKQKPPSLNFGSNLTDETQKYNVLSKRQTSESGDGDLNEQNDEEESGKSTLSNVVIIMIGVTAGTAVLCLSVTGLFVWKKRGTRETSDEAAGGKKNSVPYFESSNIFLPELFKRDSDSVFFDSVVQLDALHLKHIEEEEEAHKGQVSRLVLGPQPSRVIGPQVSHTVGPQSSRVLQPQPSRNVGPQISQTVGPQPSHTGGSHPTSPAKSQDPDEDSSDEELPQPVSSFIPAKLKESMTILSGPPPPKPPTITRLSFLRPHSEEKKEKENEDGNHEA